MDISVQSVNNGIASTNEERWVRVKGRPEGANIGRVIGSREMDHGVGHCSFILFEETGEVATYRSRDTEPAPKPA
ncbi:hypothetical protein GCM10010123_19400 [Pilimelia anulata]|uniref:Uncharacterized protein n=1 Tax=Pilimelia anulata TaxID=53371 RepID=A0A8J3F9W3_9ACTN|nr:hypothetical protein [Pilimelia anulata]GGJ89725.1 hypothetical protein GCM10010123_19400 [Pilimelia anulata]